MARPKGSTTVAKKPAVKRVVKPVTQKPVSAPIVDEVVKPIEVMDEQVVAEDIAVTDTAIEEKEFAVDVVDTADITPVEVIENTPIDEVKPIVIDENTTEDTVETVDIKPEDKPATMHAVMAHIQNLRRSNAAKDEKKSALEVIEKLRGGGNAKDVLSHIAYLRSKNR